jgi:ABC-2 type transport system permease protein
MEGDRLLLHYLRLYNRAKMAKKSSYIMEFFMSILTIGINYFLFWVMLQKLGVIEGWTYDEAAFYYAASLFQFNITCALFGLSLYFIDQTIIKGDLDKYIIKPGNLFIHLFSQNVHFFLFASSISAFILFAYMFVRVVTAVNLLRLLYFALSYVCGFFLYQAFYIFCMSFSFEYPGMGGIRNLIMGMNRFTQFPLSIFPLALRVILTLVIPIAFTSYYPCLILFDRASSALELALGLLAPFLSVLCLTLAKRWFYFQMNSKYSSTGS